MKSINDYIQENSEVIDEAKVEELSDKIYESLKEGTEVDEGFFGAIFGGIAGMTAGSAIMKAVCRALGVTQGPIYNLLTSKLVCTAAGAAIGKGM